MITDFMGRPIQTGNRLAIATRRNSSAYLFTAVVLRAETRPATKFVWNAEARRSIREEIPGVLDTRLVLRLDSCGRQHVTDWFRDSFSRAVVVEE